MSLQAPTTQAGGQSVQQPVIEADSYPARVLQVIDLGLQAQEYMGEVKDPCQEIRVVYELLDCFMVDENGNETDKPRIIGERFSLRSINQERAKSTKRMNALDRKGITGGDWTKMLGAPCTVLVTNYEKRNGGGLGMKVSDVSPVMRGYTPPKLVGESFFFDLDEPDAELWGKLPSFVQDDIKKNLNYAGSAVEALANAAGDSKPATQSKPAAETEKPSEPAPKEEEAPFEPDAPAVEQEDEDADPWA